MSAKTHQKIWMDRWVDIKNKGLANRCPWGTG